MKNGSKIIYQCILLILCGMIYPNKVFSESHTEHVLVINKNWQIQSSEKVNKKGSIISSKTFSTEGWYPASVPSTVLGILVEDSVYKNIFFGDNLKNIPVKQFNKPWWYRTEFYIPKEKRGSFVKLEFNGIIYSANIWLNGKLIGSKDSIKGVFRRFALDVTKIIDQQQKNILAVEIFPPEQGDPSIGFVDWNPSPPDKSMGLWRDVIVKTSGDVSIDFPFVQSKINLMTLKSAALKISSEVINHTDKNISGILYGEIGKIKFSRKILLKQNKRQVVIFDAKDYPQLEITSPRLWWTYNFGKPELYNLKLTFKANGKITDVNETKFGIREISDYIDKEGNRGYILNGKKILILGGGWVDNLFLNNDYENLRDQIAYIKQMGLNTIRLEGIWGTGEDLYNLCDENGILIMLGWSCQWEWDTYIGKPADEYGAIKTAQEMSLIAQSWKDQIKWLRNHPSILVWLYGSDKMPRPELEKKYLQILQDFDPSSPRLASAKQNNSEISGKTGVKMKGPYDYVPPVYWWVDKDNGGAVGFNTETGPGAEVPPVESIKKMIPEDDLWPIDSIWNYHCGKNEFGNLANYNNALFNRLGKPSNLEEYCTKAQLINYEGTRAMVEANVSSRYRATGVIYWMLNSAWPKLWWQLYDFYLMPGGAFYGVKKACEPLHILYNYADSKIIIVNRTNDKQNNLTAKISVLNFDLSEKFSQTLSINILPDESMAILQLPYIKDLSRTYFVDLKLMDKGEIISSNFYCLSTKQDQLDTAKTTWILTPAKEYADLTELNDLKNVHLSIKKKFLTVKNTCNIEVELSNNTGKLAFQVVLSVHKGEDGESILPVFWDDNYFSLLPGERRKIRGHFYILDQGKKKPFLKVSGWNIN